MALEDDPTLEDALDGLMNAANYADSMGDDDLCYRISALYQEVGEKSTDEDWEKGNSTSDADFLTWYCWVQATHGERFFKPDVTAWECMEPWLEEYLSSDAPDEMKQWRFYGGWNIERGEHRRAWSNAVEFFVDMQRHGFDPVARTERFIEESHEDGGPPLDDIDWGWLKASRYEWDWDEE